MDNDLIFKYTYIYFQRYDLNLSFFLFLQVFKKEENSEKKILPVKVVESVDLKKTITQPKNNLDTYFILFNVVILPSSLRRP